MCLCLLMGVQEQLRKRVGFRGSVSTNTTTTTTTTSDDATVSESSRPNRLHRRDTPHHLKNKRINVAIDRDKVASIIAQVSYCLLHTHTYSLYYFSCFVCSFGLFVRKCMFEHFNDSANETCFELCDVVETEYFKKIAIYSYISKSSKKVLCDRKEFPLIIYTV